MELTSSPWNALSHLRGWSSSLWGETCTFNSCKYTRHMTCCDWRNFILGILYFSSHSARDDRRLSGPLAMFSISSGYIQGECTASWNILCNPSPAGLPQVLCSLSEYPHAPLPSKLKDISKGQNLTPPVTDTAIVADVDITPCWKHYIWCDKLLYGSCIMMLNPLISFEFVRLTLRCQFSGTAFINLIYWVAANS